MLILLTDPVLRISYRIANYVFMVPLASRGLGGSERCLSLFCIFWATNKAEVSNPWTRVGRGVLVSTLISCFVTIDPAAG